MQSNISSDLKIEPALLRSLLHALLEQGLLDELILMVHPVIAGSGKRLFKDAERLKRLKLVSTKATRTGTVILTYQPVKE